MVSIIHIKSGLVDVLLTLINEVDQTVMRNIAITMPTEATAREAATIITRPITTMAAIADQKEVNITISLSRVAVGQVEAIVIAEMRNQGQSKAKKAQLE